MIDIENMKKGTLYSFVAESAKFNGGVIDVFEFIEQVIDHTGVPTNQIRGKVIWSMSSICSGKPDYPAQIYDIKSIKILDPTLIGRVYLRWQQLMKLYQERGCISEAEPESKK